MMTKRLIWTALATLSSAAAAALAVRGVSYLWQRVMHETPPPAPGWAKFLVGGVRKRVEHRIEPNAV
jgi:hypothetical protein